MEKNLWDRNRHGRVLHLILLVALEMFLFFHHQITCLTVLKGQEGSGCKDPETHKKTSEVFSPTKGTVLRLITGEEKTCNYIKSHFGWVDLVVKIGTVTIFLTGKSGKTNQFATPQNIPHTLHIHTMLFRGS